MQDSCSALKNLLKEAIALRREESGKEELKAVLTKTALEIIRLRVVTRKEVEDVELQKNSTADSKAESDLSSLQLQNLLYEKNYYSKEIASCRSFQSKYKDKDIGLIDVADFKREAPEHFLSGIEDDYELQLQRLAHEKYQRQELVQALQDVRKRKEAKELLLKEKQKYLDDIQALIGSVREAAEPLKNHLQLPPRDAAHQQQYQAVANLLPLPLYIVYRQLKAVAEIYADPVEVSVTGNDKEALALAQAAGAQIFLGQDKDVTAPASKRHKKADRKSTESDSLAHPLSLLVNLQAHDGRAIALQIFYIQQLEMVTVRATDPTEQQTLKALFSEDVGSELPSETAHELAASHSIEFSASRQDRPYVWAQHLAGLDFLPPLTAAGSLEDPADKATLAEALSKYRQQRRVQTVLHRLRSSMPQLQATADTALPLEKPSNTVPPKRVKTWEESVKQKVSRPEGTRVIANGASAELKAAEASVSEDDGALPEEGELPDT